ncbi:MAG: pyridoxal-phosphate dependent enzyme, partial [Anaerolineae bacterium]
EKLRELGLYGAEVVKIAGTYDQAKKVAQDFAERRNLYLDPGTTAIPGKEGLKTIAFEIAEQLARYAPTVDGKWRAPDWYIQAVSGGIGPIGIWKGFQELMRMGLIDKMPKLGIIQVEGCAPMVEAWKLGKDEAEPVTPRTRISVLATGDPGRGYKILRQACLETGGTMISANDGAAFRAMRRLARSEGLSMEPAASVAFAGLEQLVAEGLLKPEEFIVVNCSGHTFPAEKHVLEDEYVLDLQLGHPEGEMAATNKIEEGLGAALAKLDEQVTTVVIIDDNPQDSRLIRRLLQNHKNYRVFEANNPLDGLDLVRQRKPDLVVSDLTMPEMDGFTLLE